jgi:hypothetical protein
MDEAHAMLLADRNFRDLPDQADEVRAKSTSLVLDLYGLFRRGLVLLDAAPRIAVPVRTPERRMMAVLSCLGVQIELLWTGWQQVLNGHYAAAGVPCRTISELTDNALAAALDDRVAETLLTNGEVRNKDAREAIIRAAPNSSPSEAHAWIAYRKLFIDAYNKTAHARLPLLMSAAHVSLGRHMNVGHAFNESSLNAYARIYTQLSVNATLNAGVAFGDRLPDGGAWSVEQSRLKQDWDDFQRHDTDPSAINVET